MGWKSIVRFGSNAGPTLSITNGKKIEFMQQQRPFAVTNKQKTIELNSGEKEKETTIIEFEDLPNEA
jgi:hypothetical protein